MKVDTVAIDKYYKNIIIVCMNRTVLQIPMDPSLRRKAETTASAAGFSSVQEVVRVFLYRFVSEELEVGFVERTLSTKAQKRYMAMITDIRKGANIDHEGPLSQKV